MSGPYHTWVQSYSILKLALLEAKSKGKWNRFREIKPDLKNSATNIKFHPFNIRHKKHEAKIIIIIMR